ncbi:cutinase family protein [Nocardia jiangxiensis]|uniref:Cutinase family protein n=1 Tax=Nocardia jiangxiensis TaxID=282685 RepID=A0ABW6RTX9_9NOCA
MTPTSARAHRPAHTCRAANALIGIVVAVLAAMAALGAGPASTAPAPDATGCPTWTAVLVPGTWETQTASAGQPTGTLAPIARGLRQRYGANISVRTLATSTSETEGVHTLSTTLEGLCSSTKVVLAGYSQGADIAGDLATSIGNDQDPLPASRVAAVMLVSDPHRNTSTPQLGKPSPGQGIAGPRNEDFGALAGRVRTLCTSSDLYCSTSPQAASALAAVGRAFTNTPATNDTETPSPDQTSTPTPTPATNSPSTSGTDSAQPAADSIGGLDPSEVIEQVVSVLSGLAGFATDVPAIIGDLAQLPGLITSGNLPGLHQVSGDLNNQFAPLVQMASGIDLHLVAQALALASPLDTSGWTAIASQVVAILANLDIGRIASDIGQAQEIAWSAVQKLTTGDPAGAALALSGVIPIAGDLAVTAASALTGDAGAHLAGLAHTFTTATSPDTSNALADLARQGGDAARVTTWGAHQNRYTTGQVSSWLTSRIDATR